MLTIALRNVRENPSRYFLTGLAIALGVAFYVATTVLTATVNQSISGAIDDLYDGVDAAVRSTEVFETDFFDIRTPLDPAIVDDVSAVEGVDAVQPVLIGYAQLVGADGKVVGDQANVIVWSESDALNGYRLVEGVAPSAVTDVVVDVDALSDGELSVGDAVRILPGGTADYTIVGSMEAPSGGGIDGTTGLAFSFDGVQALYQSDRVMSINVASDSLGRDELVAALSAELSGNVEAVSGQVVADEFKELINQFVSIITIFLTVFAVIALFVAAFVIYNTFTITVAQRIKEMALLRAIGASRRQVVRNVMLESLAIGVVASVIGVVVGVGLGRVLIWVFDLIGFPLGGAGLAVQPSSLVVGFAIGMVVTLLSAIVPARRGASVPPIEALRESAVEEVGASRLRVRLGFALIVVGVVAASFGATQSRVVAAVGGIVSLLAGVMLAAPAIAPAVARFVGRPLGKATGVVGELASENAARSPKRTATTALALMVGVMLVTAATVIAASFRESIRGDLDRALAAELVVEAGSGFQGGIPTSVTAELGSLPGVSALSTVRPVDAELDGDTVSMNAVHAASIDQLLNLTTVDGSIAAIADGGIGLSQDEADDRGLGVGDTVRIDTQLDSFDLEVAAIYEPDDVIGALAFDVSSADDTTIQPLDSLVLVAADDVEAVIPAIEEVLAADPTAEVKTAGDYADEQAGALNTLLNLLYGLLALSVLIALLGVANTMTLAIYERTRELGLLRAVGMTGTQLRSSVRYESALIGLVGSVTGLALGVFFGWLTYRATIDTFPVFDLPLGQLLIIAAAGVLAGLVAGWLPARRASRLNVLEAISHE